MIDKWTSILSRVFFTVALILLIIAVSDWILAFFGWTWSWIAYTPGRMLELAAMLLIFVTVMLLRQIREKLPGK